MIRLSRRALLAGLAATSVHAEPYVPVAASLVKSEPRQPLIDGLQITDADGSLVPLDRWRGRWMVLNLWAPWCLPCKREMPSLARLSQQLDPQKIEVVALAFEQRGPIWVEKFYREEGIDGFDVLLGDADNLSDVLRLTELPVTVLIDPNGRHRYTINGEARWDDPSTLKLLQSLAG